MISTVVRVYQPEPDDIQVRWSAGTDGEVVLWWGDTVAIQAPPAELRALLGIAQLRIDSLEATMPPPGEPF